MALVVLAWASMLGQALLARRLHCCAPHPSAAEDLLAWMEMVVAMMVPTVLPNLRDLSLRSYRARRARAVIAYLLGYLGWWTLLGLAFLAARQLEVAHDNRVATALCVVAAAWVFHPSRDRWHRQCHLRTALYPVGLRADLDALRQGMTNGAPCVAMCWPLMLACAVTGHNLFLMVGGLALGLYERRMFRLRLRPLVIGALLLAIWSLTLW